MGVDMLLHDAEPEKQKVFMMRSLSTLSLPRKPPELTSTLTPPHHAMAAVPFRWEESPGKPKPSTARAPVPVDVDKSQLDLPPRLLMSSSFRAVVGGELMCRSFRESSGETAAFLGRRAVVDDEKKKKKKKRLMWCWKLGEAMKGRNEVGGGSYVFPSHYQHQFNNMQMITSSSRVDHTHRFSIEKSHFWESIADGLKQVVPWRNKRAN